MTDHPVQINIAGEPYLVERITDSAGLGYYHLLDVRTSEPVARIEYFGPDVPMTLQTFGNEIPRPTIEHLFHLADMGLA